jgi:hypothetical protein
MPTETEDLVWTRGDTMRFIGTLVPGDGQVFALPIAELKFTAKWKYQDTDVFFEKTIGAGMTIVGQSTTMVSYNGEVSPADTALIPIKKGKFVYDLQITEADGRVTTVVGGKVTLLPDVTPP